MVAPVTVPTSAPQPRVAAPFNLKQPTKISRFPYPIPFRSCTSVQGCVDILTFLLAYCLGFMLLISY